MYIFSCAICNSMSNRTYLSLIILNAGYSTFAIDFVSQLDPINVNWFNRR